MKKVCLIIMDGWGLGTRPEFDATAIAPTPNIDGLVSGYPYTPISASGAAVGLPDGQMGNSEVGHLTIGSGRVIYQELTRISKAASDGSLAANAELKNLFETAKESGGALHLMGLLSDGGVHSHIEHLKAIIESAVEAGLGTVYIHAFLDGRDTPPKSGAGYVDDLVGYIEKIGAANRVKVATVSGRYYAMDRDNRWERVQKAYDAIVSAKGESVATAKEAVARAYARGETDEFILPTVIIPEGAPAPALHESGCVLFFNFRTDRARELTAAIVKKEFAGFERERAVKVARFTTMTEYAPELNLPVLFTSGEITDKLTDVLSSAGITQFRVSETEKYAHVTFFFNGGAEAPVSGEERKLIPSVKDVPTYDLAPKMRAVEIAEAAVDAIESGRFGFVLMNFANGDMVGHTGIMDAAVEGCKAVDSAVGRVVEAAVSEGWATIIIADHGNAEQMVDYDTNEPHTAHTSNPVPFILIDEKLKEVRLKEGCGLKDVAPTVLKLMDIDKPKQMEGEAVY